MKLAMEIYEFTEFLQCLNERWYRLLTINPNEPYMIFGTNTYGRIHLSMLSEIPPLEKFILYTLSIFYKSKMSSE